MKFATTSQVKLCLRTVKYLPCGKCEVCRCAASYGRTLVKTTCFLTMLISGYIYLIQPSPTVESVSETFGEGGPRKGDPHNLSLRKLCGRGGTVHQRHRLRLRNWCWLRRVTTRWKRDNGTKTCFIYPSIVALWAHRPRHGLSVTGTAFTETKLITVT